MKLTRVALLGLFLTTVLSPGCQSFLDKEPLGTTTQDNLFKDPTNAVQAINAVYDVAAWDQGPKWGDPSGEYVPQTYEWMFGDLMTDDSEKGGSSPSDFLPLIELKSWNIPPSNGPVTTLWVHSFTGIARANTVINNIDAGTIDAALKSRLKGEALFLRAYFYFNLVKGFGGVPLFEKTPTPTEAPNATRASIAQTYAFIEKDLKEAATLLPEKSAYAAADLGRATKGAATGYLARAIMYQLGTVNGNNHTWQEVYDLTSTIITSNQYSLLANYAAIHQDIGENSSESLFEIQFGTSNDTYGPISIGTTNNIFQNNRRTFGYGFNNPTQNLVNEFEPNDPRLEVTVIKNNDIVLGILNPVDITQNATGYFNRKAAILAPNAPESGPQNIRKMRYADILLMKAEAAARLNRSAEAVALVNQVRQRARLSTRPPGTRLGTLTYDPANTPAGTLPDLAPGLSGQPLLNAIWHERRVEFGEESLRLWDMIRTGRYMNILPPDVRARAMSHVATETSVNPTPLLPISLNDAQSWKLPQNPGY
ncbi:RagB/SusD family nutrient uptake outer membrane protein [Hymenobacter fodinae]|uniref:RagB/SusD family nutrient uptake outer membrane protein n=1 Tax=Hymenobacter fodinae TaxID=2510796 RepID=A0A4Z0PAG4_9BACT|nr:RagB/SusD family nutrient uptake outer membrane protein [Hymenobacter fodinae]TGE09554.1 RagB/SusD family nutrient uptake outer membrane protein [Hymenobacter fodinae]